MVKVQLGLIEEGSVTVIISFEARIKPIANLGISKLSKYSSNCSSYLFNRYVPDNSMSWSNPINIYYLIIMTLDIT